MSNDFPLPNLENDQIRPFYEGAERGELVVPRCTGCGRFNWYPRDSCRYCDGEDLPWTVVSGEGALFSWAVVARAFVPQFAERVPYVAALVSLSEAPEVRIVSNVIECEPSTLEIGMPVHAVFRRVEFPDVKGSLTAPFFVPGEGMADPEETN